MSMTLTLATGKDEISVDLGHTDSDMLTELGRANTADVEALVAVEEAGEPARVARTTLLEAVDRLLDRLKEDCADLPYRYWIKYQYPPGTGVWNSGSGGLGGIRMNGDKYYYDIDCGLGYCRLEKGAVDEHGRGHVVETTDIRSLTRLDTDNMGGITIHRTRKQSSLERILKQLRRFLLEQDDEVIEKTIA